MFDDNNKDMGTDNRPVAEHLPEEEPQEIVSWYSRPDTAEEGVRYYVLPVYGKRLPPGRRNAVIAVCGFFWPVWQCSSPWW